MPNKQIVENVSCNIEICAKKEPRPAQIRELSQHYTIATTAVFLKRRNFGTVVVTFYPTHSCLLKVNIV